LLAFTALAMLLTRRVEFRMSHRSEIERTGTPPGAGCSVEAIGEHFLHEHVLLKGSRVIFKHNKPDGYACVSCSWAKPAEPRTIEGCENGIKATAWEITSKRTPPEFFAAHTLSELLEWSDLALESEGRLTEPMVWNSATDKSS
jgi:anaerobic selenocysteine-containing dehydrogenase